MRVIESAARPIHYVDVRNAMQLFYLIHLLPQPMRLNAYGIARCLHLKVKYIGLYVGESAIADPFFTGDNKMFV